MSETRIERDAAGQAGREATQEQQVGKRRRQKQESRHDVDVREINAGEYINQGGAAGEAGREEPPKPSEIIGNKK